MMLQAIVDGFRASRGVAHKADIRNVLDGIGDGLTGGGAAAIAVGDDCAAIPDDDGFLLFAIEGLLEEFAERDPWFAGYSAVMVNVSDVCAMGGRPIAVVDAVWDRAAEHAGTMLDGMRAAARAYRVPIVGGHSNLRASRAQLAVAILGRAARLLTSFDATPGDTLVAAIDLRGKWREPFPFWDASTSADGARLRADLELLPHIAERGLCRAAKDISNAGVLGTALMLLECSGVGATIDLAAIPAPAGVDAQRWLLQAFPSFGYLLAVAPQHVSAVLETFRARSIDAAAIGHCDAGGALRLRVGDEEQVAWDLSATPLMGLAPNVAARQGVIHA